MLAAVSVPDQDLEAKKHKKESRTDEQHESPKGKQEEAKESEGKAKGAAKKTKEKEKKKTPEKKVKGTGKEQEEKKTSEKDQKEEQGKSKQELLTKVGTNVTVTTEIEEEDDEENIPLALLGKTQPRLLSPSSAATKSESPTLTSPSKQDKLPQQASPPSFALTSSVSPSTQSRSRSDHRSDQSTSASTAPEQASESAVFMTAPTTTSTATSSNSSSVSTPASNSGPYQVGDMVLVDQIGVLYKAKILEVTTPSKNQKQLYKVHYHNWHARYDGWVSPESVKGLAPHDFAQSSWRGVKPHWYQSGLMRRRSIRFGVLCFVLFCFF